jgi:ubiquinone/menaquinone biosynthesis C-methylase UbiE
MTATRTWFHRYLDRRERRRPDPVVRQHRRQLLAGLSGSVVEVGCGVGRNFEHYPATVASVLAVEPDDVSRAVAEERAASAPVPVRVVASTAESLPAADASADAAVVCWVLCTVPDPAAALREIRRVLKPVGELRVYEHVRSPHAVFFGFQRLADALGARRLYGCESTRDTRASLEEAGFDTGSLVRLFHSSSLLTIPTAPHVFGAARLRTATRT